MSGVEGGLPRCFLIGFQRFFPILSWAFVPLW
jgi:hypothetical protein